MTFKSLAILGAVLIILGLSGLFFLNPNNTEIPAPEPLQQVLLYFYNADADKDVDGNILCSAKGLVEIERSIPKSKTIIEDTVRLLLSERSNDADASHSLTTEFPLEGFVLKQASLTDGNLLLTFDDPLMKSSGGSCRVGILWQQIEATAKQFPEVSTVLFAPAELFQP